MNLEMMKAAADILKKLGTGAVTLSHGAISKLAAWKTSNSHEAISRPNWDLFFLKIAHDIATRSNDAQTHHGAVIVDSSRHILGVGYNGFMGGIDDSWLPNTRPDKYDWMLHAELNAILNCEHKPRGATIYVTGHPCLHCFQCIAQVGIKEVVYDSTHGAVMVNDEMMIKLEIAKWLVRDKVFVRDFDYKGQSNAEF
jgi:dCMP deaminase